MKRIATCLFAAAVFIASCSGDPSAPTPTPTPNPLDQLPRPNGEAEAMALYVSEQLVAPEELYVEFDTLLAELREEHRDSVPDVDRAVFVAPWVPGEVLLRLDEAATREYRNGTYTDLDSLHAYYRMTSCDSVFAYQGRLWIHCDFAGRWHPERLAEAYAAVPSVDIAEPNGQWNNTFNVYPYKRETGFTFLVRYGWGDCPAGCIHNRFSYFKVVDGGIVWIGSWVRFDDSKPEWWEEGSAGWACFHGYDGCPP